MTLTIKTGILVIATGVLMAGIPCAQVYRLERPALRLPFPSTVGGSLRGTFALPSAGRYCFHVVCAPVGPFKETWSQTRAELPCDISLEVGHDGKNLYTDRFSRLFLGYTTGRDGNIGWTITDVDFPASGHYDFVLSNRADLTTIEVTKPLLEVSISQTNTDWVFQHLHLVLLAGGFVCIVGSCLTIAGFSARRARGARLR